MAQNYVHSEDQVDRVVLVAHEMVQDQRKVLQVQIPKQKTVQEDSVLDQESVRILVLERSWQVLLDQILGRNHCRNWKLDFRSCDQIYHRNSAPLAQLLHRSLSQTSLSRDWDLLLSLFHIHLDVEAHFHALDRCWKTEIPTIWKSLETGPAPEAGQLELRLHESR